MGKEFRNNFSWSVSRDSTFLECPRKYYFNYYGAWGDCKGCVEDLNGDGMVDNLDLDIINSRPVSY